MSFDPEIQAVTSLSHRLALFQKPSCVVGALFTARLNFDFESFLPLGFDKKFGR